MIDSEQVPWGKGEKHPGEGDEIVSETICLQGVGAPLFLRAFDDLNNVNKTKSLRLQTLLKLLKTNGKSGVTACLLKNEPTSL